MQTSIDSPLFTLCGVRRISLETTNFISNMRVYVTNEAYYVWEFSDTVGQSQQSEGRKENVKLGSTCYLSVCVRFTLRSIGTPIHSSLVRA